MSQPPTAVESATHAAVLSQLGEVRGQLGCILQLIQAGSQQTNKRIDDLGASVAASQAETNRRIDDLNTAVTARLDGMDARLQRVEDNERGTAIKAGAVGAITSAVVTAGMQLLKHNLGG